MEAQQFDAITKAWTRLPRRRVLGGLIAGTLGTLLGLGGREASAVACQRSSDCLSGQVCVHNVCTKKCDDRFVCNGSPGSVCDAAATCFCGKKPGGGTVCLTGTCTGATTCRKQRHCPAGQICAQGCCGAGQFKFVCRLPCTP